MSISNAVDSAFAALANALQHLIFFNVNVFGGAKVPFITVWLTFAGVFFLIKTKFLSIRKVFYAISIIAGKYKPLGKEVGDISSTQAFFTSLSGVIGMGSITGVGAAISFGGPGVVFWMIIAAIISMPIRFVEAVLGHKYRVYIREERTYAGGPVYYIHQGIGVDKNKPILAKFLIVFFVISFLLSSLFGLQAQQSVKVITASFDLTSDIAPVAIAAIMVVFVALVIIGGVKRIAHVASIVTPMMAVIYFLSCVVIIATNYDKLGSVFAEILNCAFTKNALYGGALSVFIISFQRTLFSNEAGMGSAPIVHSNSINKEPVREGLVCMMAPVFDIFTISITTSLVIIISGMYQNPELTGIELTMAAFKSFSPIYVIMMAFAVPLLSFSATIAWSYYGQKMCEYLFGSKSIKFYQILVCLTFFFNGIIKDFGSFLVFLDVVSFASTIPNIIALYMLFKIVQGEVEIYKRNHKENF